MRSSSLLVPLDGRVRPDGCPTWSTGTRAIGPTSISADSDGFAFAGVRPPAGSPPPAATGPPLAPRGMGRFRFWVGGAPPRFPGERGPGALFGFPPPAPNRRGGPPPVFPP